MPYIICDDNNNYVCCTKGNRFSATTDINKAVKYIKLQTAKNVCENNGRSKALKQFNWSVKYITQENKIVNEPAEPLELDFNILDKVKEISSFTRKLENRRLYLIEEMHKIDLEIVDIEHAAEFYNLNASQGYKLYKLLHDARIKRRGLKDELQKIELALGTAMKSSNMENLEKSIAGLNNRKYTPRINKELFGV